MEGSEGIAVAQWRLESEAEARSSTRFLMARKPAFAADAGGRVEADSGAGWKYEAELGGGGWQEKTTARVGWCVCVWVVCVCVCGGGGGGGAAQGSTSGARWRPRRVASATAVSAAWASKEESASPCTVWDRRHIVR